MDAPVDPRVHRRACLVRKLKETHAAHLQACAGFEPALAQLHADIKAAEQAHVCAQWDKVEAEYAARRAEVVARAAAGNYTPQPEPYPGGTVISEAVRTELARPEVVKFVTDRMEHSLRAFRALYDQRAAGQRSLEELLHSIDTLDAQLADAKEEAEVRAELAARRKARALATAEAAADAAPTLDDKAKAAPDSVDA